MKILSLEVKGYTRFTLEPKMQNLVFKPKKKLVVILGSNGCGKSSFLDLLCPRVVKSSELSKDGYVKLSVIINDINYITTSTKSGYSFIKDGKELNPTGGLKIQSALVSSILNIDPVIQSILTGTTTFTNSSVSTRREILEILSGSDFNYINYLYKACLKESRDCTAVLTHTLSKRDYHISQLAEIEESSCRASETLKTIKDNIYELMLIADSTDYPRRVRLDVTKRINRCLDMQYAVENKHNKYRRLLSSNIKLGNHVHIDKILDKHVADLNVITGSLNAVMEEHVKLDERLSNREKPAINISELREERDAILNALADSKYKVILDTNIHYSEADLALSELNKHRHILSDMACIDAVDLKLYIQDNVSRDIVEIAQEKLSRIERDMHELDNKLKVMNHMSNNKDHTCPKCKHMWKEGYDKNKHDMLIKEYNDMQRSYRSHKASYDGLVDLYERVSPYVIAYKVYARYHKSLMKSLGPLIEDIDNAVLTNPKEINHIIQRHLHILTKLSEMNALKKRLKEIEYNISIYDGITEKHNEELLSAMKDLNLKIKVMRAKKADINRKIRICKDLIGLRDSILSDIASWKNLLDGVISSIDEYVHTVEQRAIRNSITSAKAKFDRLSDIHNEAMEHQSRIDDFTKTIEAKNKELEVCKTLLDTINPKGKLVAKSMHEFINGIITEVNLILQDIWAYPLHIEYLSKDIDNLTYRFKFKANKSIRDDISMASTATADIINIAFKLVTMKALGLSTYPLYLDELGNGYDDKHGLKLIEAINKLASKAEYSHIFVVVQRSHTYEYFDSGLSERIVLSPDNLDNDVESSDSLQLLG